MATCLNNHCCNWNAATYFVYCWATCYWQQNKDTEFCTKILLWWICVAGNSNAFLDLQVKCLIFLSDFNHIWSFVTVFLESTHYQLSHKSVQWELCWYMWTDRCTDGHDRANRCFSWPCKWTWKWIHAFTTVSAKSGWRSILHLLQSMPNAHSTILLALLIQGGSNMTGTVCV